LNPVTNTRFPIHHITAGSQSGRSGGCFSTESPTITSLNFFNDHFIVFLKLFLIAPAESLLIFFRICSIMTRSNISVLLVHDRYAFSCQFTLRFTFSIASLIRASHIQKRVSTLKIDGGMFSQLLWILMRDASKVLIFGVREFNFFSLNIVVFIKGWINEILANSRCLTIFIII